MGAHVRLVLGFVAFLSFASAASAQIELPRCGIVCPGNIFDAQAQAERQAEEAERARVEALPVTCHSLYIKVVYGGERFV